MSSEQPHTTGPNSVPGRATRWRNRMTLNTERLLSSAVRARLRRTRLGAYLAVLMAVAIVATACGTGNEAAQSEGVSVPRDFEISVYRGQETLGGDEVQFSSLFAEGKPVVLNFWAGRCPPCRAEMQDLQSFHNAHKDRVVLIGLDIGPYTGLGSRDDGRALIDELGITYPTGSTSQNGLVQSYEVLGMPTTVFLRPDGRVHRTWSGLLNEQKLTEFTNELLLVSSALASR